MKNKNLNVILIALLVLALQIYGLKFYELAEWQQMLNKKIFFTIIILVIISGSIYIYRKPTQIHKSYTGIIKDIKTDKIIGKSNISLDIDYMKIYKIKNFKSIDKINGLINIDNINYDIEGITVLNDNGNYIGATASKNGESKYYIFLLDNFKYILLGELGDDGFTKQIIAPAETKLDFDEILKKLP